MPLTRRDPDVPETAEVVTATVSAETRIEERLTVWVEYAQP